MGKQELSIPALAAAVPTEAAAYEYLEDLRWGGQPEACPQCGGVGRTHFLTPRDGSQGRKTRTGSNSQRRVWFCGHCRKQFSVLTGTIFHGTKISIRTWLFVIFEMCASKNGVSAREIERKYNLTAKSAWFLLHRIREAMKPGKPLGELLALSGTIVADETWIGGNPGNQHASKRAQKPDRWAATQKQAVLSVIDAETGEARSAAVPNVRASTLRKTMEQELAVNLGASTLHTDSAGHYQRIAHVTKGHEAVNHLAGEYVRNGVSTNMAEGYFSQLKRSIDGTFHHVSIEHLPRYLAQFDFMYTHCEASDSARMRRLLGQVDGRRLTYKRIVD
jgi:transposase-like protein